ncbi:MAG: acetoacetate--CoA ligase [Chloroflexi bacterium]|nr:acetoacetate--CoA ligase [Chloroflexota bacterium]
MWHLPRARHADRRAAVPPSWRTGASARSPGRAYTGWHAPPRHRVPVPGRPADRRSRPRHRAEDRRAWRVVSQRVETIWEPTPASIERAHITRYLRWLERERGLRFTDYAALWRWSVADLDAFWASMWDFFAIRASAPYTRVLAKDTMPGAQWFPGAALNYAEHALSRRDDRLALIARSETRGLDRTTTLTYAELAAQVAAVRAGLERLGVRRGDRVVAYMPNIPETVVALLAAASLGAIWASGSPDFGTRAVIDRFSQLEPAVLLAVDGYRYGGKDFDRTAEVAEIERALPSLRATVILPYLTDAAPAGRMSWAELASATAPLEFEQVPFEHPLWVLYTSGTTGLPKGLVHGHGGILLEHLKSLALHNDLGADDRFFWFTTTGWMMWNYLLGILPLGGTALLFDGDPGHPDLTTLWRFAADTKTTYFGTSAPFIHACLKAGVSRGTLDLSALRGIGSTGAPLSPEGFRWVPRMLGRPILVGSVSGGTDLCTAFVQSCPLLPVRAGELQCAAVGAKVEAFSPEGTPVVGEVGELVITRPMPSMPVTLWNDPAMERYRASYFSLYPGIWRHGDWIRFTREGSCVIYGRSDATLNRGGVRMGTAEFYRVVEELPEVSDSLVVEVDEDDGKLVLFVALKAGATLDDDLRRRIGAALRRELSPRHVPDRILAVPAVPKTLNGKKLEVPVKRLLAGQPMSSAVSEGALADPKSIAALIDAYRREVPAAR